MTRRVTLEIDQPGFMQIICANPLITILFSGEDLSKEWRTVHQVINFPWKKIKYAVETRYIREGKIPIVITKINVLEPHIAEIRECYGLRKQSEDKPKPSFTDMAM